MIPLDAAIERATRSAARNGLTYHVVQTQDGSFIIPRGYSREGEDDARAWLADAISRRKRSGNGEYLIAMHAVLPDGRKVHVSA